MGTVIQVENLSKSYLIGHQSREAYLALRDIMVETVKNAGRRILHPMRAGSRGNSVEEIWALKDVSFEVKQGDRVGIIGRNGAGKSTLLKILSRITEPTKGRVRIKGRVGSLLEVGTGFHPELTGRENIFLNGAILGMTKAEIKRKFDEIVDFAEIEKFLDTPVKRYSSGMYVRLAFSVAAHLDPEVLLIDEVLAVGDTQFQKKCIGKMKDVRSSSQTILFVSHNMTAVRALCNRAILVKQGCLAKDGCPTDVVGEYMDNFSSQSRVREWKDEEKAPKNSTATIRKVSICDAGGEEIDRVFTDTDFHVEIDYTVNVDGSSVGLTVVFNDSENNCVFGSINNHEINFYGKSMKKGVYKSICSVPANLFNNGFYFINITIFGKNYSDPVIVSDALSIEIFDGIKVRGDFHGVYAGTFRPLLNWRTNLLEEVKQRDV